MNRPYIVCLKFGTWRNELWFSAPDDAETAEEVKTESQAQSMLTERGFTDQPIETEYSMDGTYSASEEISEISEERHPLYETYYFNQSGEVWQIYLINGCLVANPLSYNAQPGLERLVLISESEVVTSYDNYTNRFYDTIPDPDVMTVVLVDTIDAETLDMLTVEVIGRL